MSGAIYHQWMREGIYSREFLSKPANRALAYAETYGICEYYYKPEKEQMIYYSSFPVERKTYRCVVDLNTMKEKREPLEKYYAAYKSKIGGNFVACDRI